jgi:hypothetical protein
VPGNTDAIGANNHPLRGGKHTAYEGGVRVVGFVHGSALLHSLPRPLEHYSAMIEGGSAMIDGGADYSNGGGVAAPPGRAVAGTMQHTSPAMRALQRLNGAGSTYGGMMHVVDWLDTICEVAGCSATSLGKTLVWVVHG